MINLSVFFFFYQFVSVFLKTFLFMRLIYDVYLMLILCQRIFKTCLVSKPLSLCVLPWGGGVGEAGPLEMGCP